VPVFAIWSWVPTFLSVVILLLGIFLIFLILIQRGKGGGLSGAFGGVGGSSAFGTRAGDVFTRITIVTAAIWFILVMVQVVVWQNVSTGGPTSPIEGSGAPIQGQGPNSPIPAPEE